jgi:hypothetical protein
MSEAILSKREEITKGKSGKEKQHTAIRNELELASNEIAANTETKQAEKTNSDSNWTHVTKRLNKNANEWANSANKSKNRNIMTGQSKDDINLAKAKRYHFYSGNWRSDVECDEVRKKLEKFLNVLEFEELKSNKPFNKNYERSKSFHITIDEKSLSEAKNPSNWPHGIIVKRFFFWEKTRNKNDINEVNKVRDMQMNLSEDTSKPNNNNE